MKVVKMNNEREEMRESMLECTVQELKAESREHGLKLQKNGKKFTKAELIENLLDYYYPQETEDTKSVESENKEQKKVKKEKKDKAEKVPQENYIHFATTFEEIVEKYGGKKKDYVYDNILDVGSIVLFIHHVVAKYTGETYKKLRTAKVIGVDRKNRIIQVETILGTSLIVSFDELLYIKSSNENSMFPKDIKEFLRNRRTKKGAEKVHEAFGDRKTIRESLQN